MTFKFNMWWDKLRTSFWFIPSLMIAVAVISALILPTIDEQLVTSADMTESIIYIGGASSARTLLSTVAGAMISIAGLTFSITVVALTLASSQLGPRLLNNFMRDRGNQVVLGTFVSLFIYCVLVLRTVRDAGFVPHLAVTVAIVLTLISIGILIYFFHHIAVMLQAQTVITHIGQELETSIKRLFPKSATQNNYDYRLRDDADLPANFDDESDTVSAHRSGYLQAINYDALVNIAIEHDAIFKCLYRAGDFIANGTVIMRVYPDHILTDELEKAINQHLVLGVSRARLQDVEFAVAQLVEIAVRALSPGVNDPFTAIACLDQFSNTLSTLAESTITNGYYYDSSAKIRVISDRVSFVGIIDAAFNQIRQHAQTDVAVTIRMLEVIAVILAKTKTASQRAVLIKHAEMIKRGSDEAIHEPNDRADIQMRYDVIMKSEPSK
jgi:uncharacterized membrane protein